MADYVNPDEIAGAYVDPSEIIAGGALEASAAQPDNSFSPTRALATGALARGPSMLLDALLSAMPGGASPGYHVQLDSSGHPVVIPGEDPSINHPSDITKWAMGEDAYNYGKGTPIGAVGEQMIGMAGNPVIGGISALGAGFGRKYGGSTGELIGALLPGLYGLVQGARTTLPSVEDPQVQTALKYMSNKGALDRGVESVRSISPRNADAIEVANTAARSLDESIAGELGALAMKNQYEAVLADQFDRGAPLVREAGVFDTPRNTKELLSSIESRLGNINDSRSTAVKTLMEAFNDLPESAAIKKSPVWEGMPISETSVAEDTRNLIKVAEQTPKPNAPTRAPVWSEDYVPEWSREKIAEWKRKPLKELYQVEGEAPKSITKEMGRASSSYVPKGEKPGIINNKSPEIADAMKELRTRISKLEKAPYTETITEGLKGTMESMREKLAKGVTPEDAVDMMQSLNEARRTLAKEFDTLTEAKKIGGNTASYGHFEGSIEAIGKMQRAISDALEASVVSITKEAGIEGLQKDQFTKWNKEYGALKATENLVSKFNDQIRTGMATRPPTAAIQNPGAPAPTGNIALPHESSYWLQKIARSLLGGESTADTALNQMKHTQGMSEKALENIRALMSLNKSPANIPSLSDQRWERLMQVLMGAPASSTVTALSNYEGR